MTTAELLTAAATIKNETVGGANTALRVGSMFENIVDLFSNIQIVNEKSDFPAAVSGVITLEANKTYVITSNIDLLGDRIVAGGVCNFSGYSSETSFITSTGLSSGVPLITTEYTIVLDKITFKDVDTCLDINGNSREIILDWRNVNFSNIPNIGTINTCNNFIFETGAVLNSKGLKFTGTIGTVAFNNSLFEGDGNVGSVIELDASCVITRRFRIIYSSIIADSSTIGITVNASATIPVEAYILDTINFSGGGTYLSGVTQSSNKALFISCVGIVNTAVNGQVYMQGNATATTISNTTNFFKVAGTTTASSDNSKYLSSNNRLTCDATIERKYLIQATISFIAGNNNVCEFGFYDSKLGAIRTPSKTKATANTSGRAENVSLMCVVQHSQGDYIEVHCRNTTSTSSITVEYLNLVITEIR